MRIQSFLNKIRQATASRKRKAALVIVSGGLLVTSLYLFASGKPGGGLANITGAFSPPPKQTVLELQGNEAVYDLVTLHSGEITYSKNVLGIPSRGLDLNITLNYRSQGRYDGPFGWNWDSPINQRLEEQGSGDVYYFNGFGRRDTFAWTGSNYTSPPGYYQALTKNGDDTFTLTNPQGVKTNFNAAGRLTTIEDTNGNRLTFSYTGSQLTSITDALGRQVTLSYYSTGRLKHITDFTGRTWTLVYTDEGDLNQIKSPATPDSPLGRTETLAYLTGKPDPEVNHNLKQITLASGKIYRTVSYGAGDSTEAASAINLDATATIGYDFAQRETTVDEPNGNQFDVQFTSGAADPPYAPIQSTVYTNLNVRPGEGNYTTSFAFNHDGEATQTTFPKGNSLEWAYDTTNSDPKKRGNLLSFTRRSNPTITTSYTYESQFNKVKTITDPEGNVTTNYYDYEEATLGDLNGDGLTSQSAGNLVKTTYPTVTVPASQEASETFDYNRYGQIIRTRDTAGVRTRYLYFRSGDPRYGYLSDVVSDIGAGRLNIRTRYNVDRLGNLIEETNPRGVKTTYTRNALGELLTTRIIGSDLLYRDRNTYDPDGNVIKNEVQLRDEDGPIGNTWISKEYSYDENRLLLNTTESISATQTAVTSYDYDGNMNLIRVTRPEGNRTRYIYDERNLLYQQVDGEGSAEASTRTINYDANGNVTEEISGVNTTTTYQYDGFDRLMRRTRPLGNYTTYAYDQRSNLIQSASYSSTDTLLARTGYRYDQRGRNYQLDQLILDENLSFEATATTLYNYDRRGLLTSEIDPLTKTTSYTYDNVGRLLSTVDPVGNRVDYTYDPVGNRVKQVRTDQNELGGTEVITDRYRYDALNRMISSEDSSGNVARYSYDSLGRLLKTTDPKGNTKRYQYDYLGRELRDSFDLRDTTGTITDTIDIAYAYDRNGNLTAETDDNSNTTRYQYDALDRLTARTNADSTTVSYQYDRNSRLTRFIDENETTVTYSYDNNDRLTQKDIQRAAGVEGITQETYQYDGADRLSQTTDSAGTIQQFRYDSLARLRREIEDGRQIASAYDLAGRRTAITYPGGTAVGLPRTNNGLIDQVTVGGSQIADYRYVGLRTKEKNLANSTRTAFTYDIAARLTRVLHQKTVGPITIADFQYGYDKNGNRTYEKRNHEGGKGDIYAYDSLDRVVGVDYRADSPETGGASPESRTTYQYDGVGNRTQVVSDNTTETYTMSAATPEPADRQMNQYTAVGGASYTHDRNGNLTSDSTRTYVYDYKNRLVRVRRNSDSRDIAFYTYDSQNRRLSKRVWDDGSSTYTVTRFVWDGWQLVEERDATDTVIARYVYGRGIDEPLIMERGGQRYYYHANALGSITHVTNSSGNVVEKYSYDVYGRPTIKDASDNTLTASAIGNRYMFTGREYDPETGFYYYRNRYYDPRTGRFLTRDPLGLLDGLNLHEYVLSSPANYQDPFGYAAQAQVNIVSATYNAGAASVDFTYRLTLNPDSNSCIRRVRVYREAGVYWRQFMGREPGGGLALWSGLNRRLIPPPGGDLLDRWRDIFPPDLVPAGLSVQFEGRMATVGSREIAHGALRPIFGLCSRGTWTIRDSLLLPGGLLGFLSGAVGRALTQQEAVAMIRMGGTRTWVRGGYEGPARALFATTAGQIDVPANTLSQIQLYWLMRSGFFVRVPGLEVWSSERGNPNRVRGPERIVLQEKYGELKGATRGVDNWEKALTD